MNPVDDGSAAVSNAYDALSSSASYDNDCTESSACLFNFEIVRTLGRGAYGVVLLGTIPGNAMVTFAVKCARPRKREDVWEALRKEALLQRALRNHENVLKYFAMREDNAQFQLFMEYAAGGELFDRIEPDVGMPPTKAYFYFKQLMDGLQYIHSKGIVHRDIKPENLLLTADEVLKIADFGLATVFRNGDRERHLSMQCGTTAYAAPEVFSGCYRGEPVDVWSAGVVFVAMLTGVLPWSKATGGCDEYQNWMRACDLARRPWSQIEPRELSLMKTILCAEVEKRAAIDTIKDLMSH